MFFEIFWFEIKYNLKRPATYIYFGLFAAFAFLMAIIAGNVWPEVKILMDGKVFVNSPFYISLFCRALSNLGIIITAAIVGNAVYRDYEYATHSLFFTKPVSKFGYLGGRFAGACVIATLALSGIAFGYALGCSMPFIDPTYIGPAHLSSYIRPYIMFVIPNLIFTGIIFFMLAALTRNILSVYIVSILLLVFNAIAGNLEKNLSNKYIASLIDPLGSRAFGYMTEGWTVAQQNANPLPMSGVLLVNRLIWLGVGLALFIVLFMRFRFDQFSSDSGTRKKVNAFSKAKGILFSNIKVTQVFSFSSQFSQFLKISLMEIRNILRSPFFLILVGINILLMIVEGTQIGKIYNTTTYPVTAEVAKIFSGGLIMLVIIVFYSGELIWKERELKINNISDALPVPTRVTFASRFMALIGVEVVLLFVTMLCGIITQICYGYYKFEFGVYFQYLFIIKLLELIFVTVIALVIQILVNQKYLGYFIVIAYIILSATLLDALIEHNMLKYGQPDDIPFSSMNGFGHFWPWFLWFKFYWLCFAGMLIILSSLFWVRGTEENFRARLKSAGARFKGNTRMAFFFTFLLFLGSGSFIYYNTNILHHYKSEFKQEEDQVSYEKKYKKYEHIPQPRITAVEVHTDIYPYERAINFKGSYVLENKTNKSIDSIHVQYYNLADTNEITFNVPFKRVYADSIQGYNIYALALPLMPHDSIIMNMHIHYAAKGFDNTGGGTNIIYNGTFTNSGALPSIGYSSGGELANNQERKKFGLPYKEPIPGLNDTAALRNNCLTPEADWIRYDATVSTSADQIAFTSGNMDKQWQSGGRNYFHYTSASKILLFAPFVSARYKVKEDHWNDIALKIYYTEGHEYNLDRMMQALKDGLAYYTVNFGPYQFNEVKIMEFPYGNFAQSFANTIPFSENIGFVADVQDDSPDDLDYPYYVTAHELAHQWWGHQVIGANMQGSVMMMETMAQYSALMIMKQRYGVDKMKKFLRYEMNSYLTSRAFEQEKELPLYRTEGQSYVYYRKGSVVMYALQDYIGEHKLDSALHQYVHDVRFQNPPYTNSLQFLKYISSAVPDSMKYLINDMFKSIIVFNNKATKAEWKKQADSTYKVHIEVESHKLSYDSAGNEKEVALNDWIDVGVFGQPKDGAMTPMFMKRKKITQSKQVFDVIVAKKPYEAGIDPYFKLIDKHPDDNVMTLTEAK